MAEILIKFFILLVGFGVGFLLACAGAARIVTEKAELKKELARVKAELTAEKASKTRVIEINDNRTPNTDYFEKF